MVKMCVAIVGKSMLCEYEQTLTNQTFCICIKICIILSSFYSRVFTKKNNNILKHRTYKTPICYVLEWIFNINKLIFNIKNIKIFSFFCLFVWEIMFDILIWLYIINSMISIHEKRKWNYYFYRRKSIFPNNLLMNVFFNSNSILFQSTLTEMQAFGIIFLFYVIYCKLHFFYASAVKLSHGLDLKNLLSNVSWSFKCTLFYPPSPNIC